MEELKTGGQRLESWSRWLLPMLLVFLLLGCSYEVELFNPIKNVSAKELNAGPSASLVRKTKKDNKSPRGVYDETDSFRIKNDSDTIKAEKGAQFGMEFILLANTKGKAKIKAVWTFPKEITNKKGKSFSSYKLSWKQSTHERTFIEFRMVEQHMVVKGPWKLELFHKREKILEKVFYLI